VPLEDRLFNAEAPGATSLVLARPGVRLLAGRRRRRNATTNGKGPREQLCRNRPARGVTSRS
jgi:hypothetical protein